MEPFHITCVTCRARLKVQSARVIGQIVACPKCESMVEVSPPPGWSPASSTPAAMPTASGPPPVEHPAPSSPPEDLEAAATAPAEAASRRIALWISVGGCAAATVMAVLAFSWYRSSQSPDTVSAAETTSSSPPLVSSTPVEPPTAGPVPTEQDDSSGPTEPAPPLPRESEDTGQEADIEAADETPASVQTASNPPRPQQREELSPLLPGDAIQAAIFDGLDEIDAAVPAPPIIAGQDVGDAGEDDDAVARGAVQPPAVRVTVERAMLPSTRRDADPQKLLGFPLESFELDELSLVAALDLIENLTHQPITVEPVQLEMAGVAATTQVSVNVADVTCAEALAELLKPLGLRYEVDGSDVLVKVGRRGEDPVRYPVDDILDADGVDDAGGLARWLTQVVAPSTWQTVGGKGQISADGTELKVSQSARVHHEIRQLLDRIRLTRGLAPRTGIPEWSLTQPESRRALLSKLDKLVAIRLYEPTALRDLPAHWQRLTGSTLLMDWQGLEEVGFSPDTMIRCESVEQSSADVLSNLLEQLGLSWYAVDGQTIYVSTVDRLLDDFVRTELHTVARAGADQAVASGDGFDSLRAHLRETLGDTESPALLQLDQSSGYLVATAPPLVQRLIRQWLESQSAR